MSFVVAGGGPKGGFGTSKLFLPLLPTLFAPDNLRFKGYIATEETANRHGALAHLNVLTMFLIRLIYNTIYDAKIETRTLSFPIYLTYYLAVPVLTLLTALS